MRFKYFFSISLVFYSLIVLASCSTTSWSFGNFIFHNNVSLEFQVTITSPSEPGIYPAIFFLTGLDGLCPTFFYTNFSNYLVDNGNLIFISFDRLRILNMPSKEEKVFEITLDWAIKNINGLFTSDKTPLNVRNKVFPDQGPNGFTLMSHSAAAHPVVLYMYYKCGPFKKLILMDPVDGFDPFGIIKIFVTNPPQQLPFQTPTLILSTGLDPIPIKPNPVACAPNNISNNRFYESLPGPTFYLNFTSYGHADFFDEFAREEIVGLVCTTCDKVNKDCDFYSYRKNLASAIKYFITAVDNKNQIYLNAIEYPSKSGLFNDTIKIYSKFNLNGFDILSTGSFCNHS